VKFNQLTYRSKEGNREQKHIIGGEPALLLTNRGGNAD
jgi:hypothetical protein